MMKFCGEDPTTGRKLLGIGLSRKNCEKLLKGEPIGFVTDGMGYGMPELSVMIMAGETEETMAATFLQEGLLTPDQIHDEREIQRVDESEVN